MTRAHWASSFSPAPTLKAKLPGTDEWVQVMRRGLPIVPDPEEDEAAEVILDFNLDGTLSSVEFR
jgi:hypothetical protein